MLSPGADQTRMRLEDPPSSSWDSRPPRAQLQPQGEVGGSRRGSGTAGRGMRGSRWPLLGHAGSHRGTQRLSRLRPRWNLSFVGQAGTDLGDLPPRPPHASVTTGLSCDSFILGHRHAARSGLRSMGPRLLKIKIELVKLMQRLLL